MTRFSVRIATMAMTMATPLGLIGCGLWPTLDVECLQSGRCTSPPQTRQGFEVFGQPDEHTNLQLQRGLNHPTHAIRFGDQLVIADSGNHRVLIRYMPAPDAERVPEPDLVLGQPDFATNAANHGGLSASSMSAPHSLATDGKRLFVADSGNNRVLVYSGLPTQNYQPADLVVGQADLTSAGSAVTDRDFLGGGVDVGSGGERELLVIDPRAHRVLSFEAPVEQNHPAAKVALGQSSLLQSSANGGLASANDKGLREPHGAAFAVGKRSGICDQGNHRVLIWDSIPVTSGGAAKRVLGQLDMSSSLPNGGGLQPGASGLDTPTAAAGVPSGAIAIADRNGRILVWSTYPTTDGEPANFVIGQDDFSQGKANAGGLSARSISVVEGLSFSDTDLYAADSDNNRVLMFSGLPTTNRPSARRVFGQPDFISADANNAGEVSASVYNLPLAVSAGGDRLAIADSRNHRVLLWNHRPTASGTPPDLALGQPDFASSAGDTGASRGGGLSDPVAVWTDGTRLAVADLHRVLIWTSWPSTNLQRADLVLGQPDFTTNQPNSGGVSASSLWKPTAISSDGEHFAISDSYNHRVLLWKSFPTMSHEPAQVAIGQSTLGANSGGLGMPMCVRRRNLDAGPQTLACPVGVFVDGKRLYVGDSANARALIWNSIPEASGASADIVLGQVDFTASTPAEKVSAIALRSAAGIAVHEGRLYVSDPLANRIVYWDSPKHIGQAADGVIGQTSFDDDYRSGGGLDEKRLAQPLGLYATTDRIYIADSLNHRLLALSHP